MKTTIQNRAAAFILLLCIIIRVEPAFSSWIDLDDYDLEEEEGEEEITEKSEQFDRLFQEIAEHDRQMLLSGSVPVFPEEEEPHYLVPRQLKPFQMVPLVLRRNGVQTCPFARLMRLPEKVTDTIRDFTERSGLMDLFWSHTYGDTSPVATYDAGEDNFDATELSVLNAGREWITMRPVSNDTNWPNSDIHWMDTANEAGYEEVLQVLRDANFDPVVQAIAKMFESESLTVTAMGFMAVTHSYTSKIHQDNKGSEDSFFQMLLPIVLPEDDVATLLVGGYDVDDEEFVEPIRFREHTGIIISGDTWHATPTFDFRPKRGLRVVASIYIADLTDDEVVPVVAGDGTAVFPPRGMLPWFEAQAGRHFSINPAENVSLQNDPGRSRLRHAVVADEWDPDECAELKEQGKCRTDIYDTRMNCFQTCGVFIDDETYFSVLYQEQRQLTKGNQVDDITEMPLDELEALLEKDALKEYDYWRADEVTSELTRRVLVEKAREEIRDKILKKQQHGYNASSPYLFSEDDEPHFLVPRQLQPYEIVPFVHRTSEEIVCPYARVIGLPEQLTQEITDFAERSGLMDLFWSHTYGTTSPKHKDEGVCRLDPFWWTDDQANAKTKCRWVEDDEFFGWEDSKAQLDRLKDGRQWITIFPGQESNWPASDIHWMDTANEAGYEEVLHVMQRGGFDRVLEQMGHEFEASSWAVTAMGFMAITHSTESRLHQDNKGSERNFFQMLIPIILPEHDRATLEIGSGDEDVWPVQFRKQTGIIISGNTWHATPTFDYRPNHGLRVVASIYFAQLQDESSIRIVAGDGTAVFPPRGMTEWFAAQHGRHWGKGHTLATDPGRTPLGSSNHDKWDTKVCQAMARKGRCQSDIWVTRMACLKTCGVFIDDEVYYSQLFPAAAAGNCSQDSALETGSVKAMQDAASTMGDMVAPPTHGKANYLQANVPT